MKIVYANILGRTMRCEVTLSEDQINSLRADYLYEMATETGFGAPKLWNQNAPRNFAAFLASKGFGQPQSALKSATGE